MPRRHPDQIPKHLWWLTPFDTGKQRPHQMVKLFTLSACGHPTEEANFSSFCSISCLHISWHDTIHISWPKVSIWTGRQNRKLCFLAQFFLYYNSPEQHLHYFRRCRNLSTHRRSILPSVVTSRYLNSSFGSRGSSPPFSCWEPCSHSSCFTLSCENQGWDPAVPKQASSSQLLCIEILFMNTSSSTGDKSPNYTSTGVFCAKSADTSLPLEIQELDSLQ